MVLRYYLDASFLNFAAGNKIEYCAENDHYFDTTCMLSRIIVFAEEMWQHTYFMFLPFVPPQWHSFKSRHCTISGCASFISLLLDSKHGVYHGDIHTVY